MPSQATCLLFCPTSVGHRFQVHALHPRVRPALQIVMIVASTVVPAVLAVWLLMRFKARAKRAAKEAALHQEQQQKGELPASKTMGSGATTTVSPEPERDTIGVAAAAGATASRWD